MATAVLPSLDQACEAMTRHRAQEEVGFCCWGLGARSSQRAPLPDCLLEHDRSVRTQSQAHRHQQRCTSILQL